MLWSELGQVPDVAVDDQPAVFWRVVFGDLFDGEKFWGTHGWCGDKRRRDKVNGLPPTTGLLAEAGGLPYCWSWLMCRRRLVGEVEVVFGRTLAEISDYRLRQRILDSTSLRSGLRQDDPEHLTYYKSPKM